MTESVAVLPGQTVILAGVMLIGVTINCEMLVAADVPLQPVEFVTDTEKLPAADTYIEAVVAPVDQV